tara:strand:- start:523 stop:888 length:366 start_codon:yes stop_codon:yes gene_type:complete
MKKIYISGPQIGLPHANLPAFIEAMAAVKAAGNECAFVDRSINTDVAGANELASQNIHKADAVLMLPGWEGHASCKFELDVAIAIDRNVLYFDTNLAWHKIGGKDIYGVFVKYPLDDEEDA